jgi:hypothetical protein
MVKNAPPGYYDALCEDIAAKGRTPRDYADNTTKGTKSLLRKWHGSVALQIPLEA